MSLISTSYKQDWSLGYVNVDNKEIKPAVIVRFVSDESLFRVKSTLKQYLDEKYNKPIQKIVGTMEIIKAGSNTRMTEVILWCKAGTDGDTSSLLCTVYADVLKFCSQNQFETREVTNEIRIVTEHDKIDILSTRFDLKRLTSSGDVYMKSITDGSESCAPSMKSIFGKISKLAIGISIAATTGAVTIPLSMDLTKTDDASSTFTTTIVYFENDTPKRIVAPFLKSSLSTLGSLELAIKNLLRLHPCTVINIYTEQARLITIQQFSADQNYYIITHAYTLKCRVGRLMDRTPSVVSLHDTGYATEVTPMTQDVVSQDDSISQVGNRVPASSLRIFATMEEFYQALREIGLNMGQLKKIRDVFEYQEIIPAVFSTITDEDLEKYGLKQGGLRKAILKVLGKE
jgi:hypothetical protein